MLRSPPASAQLDATEVGLPGLGLFCGKSAVTGPWREKWGKEPLETGTSPLMFSWVRSQASKPRWSPVCWNNLQPVCDGGVRSSLGALCGCVVIRAALLQSRGNHGKMNHCHKYRSGWKNTTLERFPSYLGKKWRSMNVLLPLTFRPIDAIPAHWAKWMLGAQRKRGRSCQACSPASSSSPNVLIASLWIQAFPRGSCCCFGSRVSRD